MRLRRLHRRWQRGRHRSHSTRGTTPPTHQATRLLLSASLEFAPMIWDGILCRVHSRSVKPTNNSTMSSVPGCNGTTARKALHYYKSAMSQGHNQGIQSPPYCHGTIAYGRQMAANHVPGYVLCTTGHSSYLFEEIVGLRAQVILHVLLERMVQWGETHNNLFRRHRVD